MSTLFHESNITYMMQVKVETDNFLTPASFQEVLLLNRILFIDSV